MQYRLLGATGLSVSIIGFGASPLGNVFAQVPAEEDVRTVRAAIDLGINFFDVAPYYGMGMAEERLGRALGSKRQNIVLATKCGRYGSDAFDFSPKTITSRLEDSLRRLRTDHVDLLQAHDIEFGDLRVLLDETLPAMESLRQQGKTRFIGITGYWPGFLAHVASSFPIDTVLNYCHGNLFADDMDLALTPLARGKGIGLINASPLHMGLLGGGTVPSWHPAPERVRYVAMEVNALCQRWSVDPASLALHACLQHPVVASTFIGMASPAQVQQNCAALDLRPNERLVAEIRDLIAPVFNTVWPQGKTENADTLIAAHEAIHAG